MKRPFDIATTPIVRGCGAASEWPTTQAAARVRENFKPPGVAAAPWFHLPIQWSLGIVAGTILISVVASLALSKAKAVAAGEAA